MTTRVVHCKREPHDVYIGRPSKWGNPFAVRGVVSAHAKHHVDTVDEALTRYEAWLREQPQLMAALAELRGKTLGCWCKPGPCHGDVLARLADGNAAADPLLALSVMQPWASLIVGGPRSPGVKPIENRTWKPSPMLIGRRIAIHASKKLDLEAFEDLQDGACDFKRSEWPYAKIKEFPTGAIIGTATLVRVHVGDAIGPTDPVYPDGMPDDCKRWYCGPVGLELRSVVRVEPVPCKGALGFWRMPGDVEQVVRAQIARAA